jgi:hypothetical protein
MIPIAYFMFIGAEANENALKNGLFIPIKQELFLAQLFTDAHLLLWRQRIIQNCRPMNAQQAALLLPH